MDDSAQSDVTIAIPAPANPAGAAAKAELAAIMTDPNNLMHQGWLRHDKAVLEHVNGIYKTAYPTDAAPATTAPSQPTAPASGREPEQPLTMTPEDRVAQAENEAMLQRTLGADYPREMADMRIGVRDLCSTPDVVNALAILTPLIEGSGALAQALGIRLLAEVGRSVNTRKGGRP
jgi:hypothetical protein